MEALREGEKLMRLIESSPLPAPSPQALQRASAAILSELRAASKGPRLATPRPKWLLQAAAAIPGFLLPILIARHLDREGWAAPLLLLAAAAVLTASARGLRPGALVALAAAARFALRAGGGPRVPLSRAGRRVDE